MSQKKHKKQRQILQQQVLASIVEKRSLIGLIKENIKYLLGLAIGIFILYFNSLNGAFVSDDYAGIPNNPLINDFSHLFKDFYIVDVCNFLINKIFGNQNPIPYHVFNMILYVAVCFAAFILIRMLFTKTIAYLSIALFAVLPVHVEAVSWISGKPYLLVYLFVLLGLIFLIQFFETNDKNYLWPIIPFYVLAYFSDRPRSLSFFLLAVLYVVVYRKRILAKINFGKIFMIGGGILAILAIIMWNRIKIRILGVNTGYNLSDSVFYSPFFQYPTAITKYLQLTFMPVDLTLYHTMYILPAWLNWTVLVVYLIALAYFFIKNKDIFFALAFIFVATAPSMAPVKVSWLVAERYVFMGSLGFCLAIALIIDSVKQNTKIILMGLAATVFCLYGVRTFLRNVDWQTNHNLWVRTVQVSPNSHNAWNNIGDDYDKLKRYNDSIKSFTQSVTVKPNYADAYHNRANILFKIGRMDLARDSYETALKYSPSLYQTYISLTQVDLNEKKYDLALQHANKIVELSPTNMQSYYILAVVYAQSGNKDEAKKILKSILQANPNVEAAADLLKQLN